VNGAECLAACLENEQTRFVFGVPGEETLALYEALRDRPLEIVTCRHEQGAVLMTDVHGRLTGRAGVCLSTLGPGATNLMTGVADADLDRAPPRVKRLAPQSGGGPFHSSPGCTR